jgi:hypothetical protein
MSYQQILKIRLPFYIRPHHHRHRLGLCGSTQQQRKYIRRLDTNIRLRHRQRLQDIQQTGERLEPLLLQAAIALFPTY